MTIKYAIRRCLSSQKGFTLVELLIVTAIMGILAGITVPSVSSFLDISRQNAANLELENVKTAAVGYDSERGVWPDDSTELTNYLNGTPKATYIFDTTTGYIIGVSDNTWPHLTWVVPSQPYTQHGEWKKS